MRLGSIIATATCCLAAAPIAAAPIEQDMPARDTALLQLADRRPTLASLPRDTHLPLAAKVRLRTGLVAAPTSQAPVRLRPRAATAMVDLYPIDGQGFHVSGGTRFFARRNLATDVDAVSRGLLAMPQWRGNGLRTGLRRFSPTATLGYTGTVATGLDIGMEAGARMGGAFDRGPRPMRLHVGDDRPGADRVVPMANLLVAYHF